MILWRLSGLQFARSFDGGYGLLFNGRWNSVGHAVTYCATSPALCVLEKLVHIEDPNLLPPLVMVQYNVPDDLAMTALDLAHFPDDWRQQEGWFQTIGDQWHETHATPLLKVPSAIVPVAGSPDLNVIINHQHPDVQKIEMISTQPFRMDNRLL